MPRPRMKRSAWYRGMGTGELKELIRWMEYKIMMGREDIQEELDRACFELGHREEC